MASSSGVIEEVLIKFRDRKKATTAGNGEGSTKDKHRMLNVPISFNPNKGLKTVEASNTSLQPVANHSDQTMQEFDQYVLYNELKKGATELNRPNGKNIERSKLIPTQVDEESNSTPVAHKDQDGEDCEIVMESEYEEDISEQDEDSPTETDEESSKGADDVYMFPTPEEITTAKTPEVGMVFDTLADAVRFVNLYAHLKGFSVIKGRSYKQRKYTLQCNKTRETRTRSSGQRKRRRNAIVRTNCQMNIIVKQIETKWTLVSCDLEHNHEMSSSPSLTKFFLSHRTMTSDERMLSQLLQEIRVKPQRIMTMFRKLKGSSANVKFGKKNLENLNQAAKKIRKNSDIQFALKYIQKIQLKKPGFCCKMEVNTTTGAVFSLFWTDARARMNYKLYGEIIYFDTTYCTNRYNMPFAPIIGINGNGRTIVFGWALLKDQKAKTFEWLFESFVEVMEGKRPKLILTDQDVAIANAISDLFPDAWHRFCIWHILKNLRQNESSYMAEREGMEDCIVNLIMESLSVKEFEVGWSEMLKKYECANHEHLIRMWKARAHFVPAYSRGKFCPFTRTTGRSESFNSNFKEYVKRKDTIETFFKQYELFEENKVEIENEDLFHSTQQKPTFWCRQPIERHAAAVYTRGIYLKFTTELVNSTAFGVTEVVKDQIYELKKLFWYEKPEYRRDMFTVVVDKKTMTMECECGKLDKDGILCCHILRLFTQWDVVAIPEQYIVPRWTTEFREKELMKHKQETIEVHGSSATHNALRYALLLNNVNDVCAAISRDEEKTKEFIEEVHKLHKRLMSDTSGKQAPTDVPLLRDPPVIKKATNQKNKQPETEVDSVRTAGKAPTEKSVNIWINEDGSISKPVAIEDKPKKTRGKAKKKQLEDPTVSSSKSVNKGNIMKPQSEKNSKRRKEAK